MLEGKNKPLSLQRVNAQKWGTEILEGVRPLAEKKEIDLFAEVDQRIGELAFENRSMTQLVQGLLSSAIITSPDGGCVGLEITGDALHDTVHLTVWDSGDGLQGSDILRLFTGEEAENRFDQKLRSLPELVFKHEGLVSINNSPGYGSRVTLSFPWKEPLLAINQTPPARATGHVLVVDDDELNIYTISSYLRSLGFEVTTAYNGWEGVEKVIRSKPDLVLMDVNMPIMNGIEAIRHIRSLGEDGLAQLPVLVLSAYSMSSDQNDCLAAGANEFISKPVSMRWLRQKVDQYLPQLPTPKTGAALV